MRKVICDIALFIWSPHQYRWGDQIKDTICTCRYTGCTQGKR